jgi:hypothetical protein
MIKKLEPSLSEQEEVIFRCLFREGKVKFLN